ncbi:MAG: hypothetical protein ACE361_03120 [Aureliella sp.]
MLYSIRAISADEIAYFLWADRQASSEGAAAYFTRPFVSGYGGLYWTLYINCLELFKSDAIWAMRWLACLCWMSLPLAIAWFGRYLQGIRAYGVAMLWITMPLAWWCGKVAGPESFAVCFGTHGCIFLLLALDVPEDSPKRTRTKRLRLAWILLGVSVAIKLTMIPFLIFASIYQLQQLRSQGTARVQTCLGLGKCFAVCCGTFVICDPAVVFDFARTKTELAALPYGNPWNANVFRIALSNQTWTWDGVFSGGLMEWGLSLPSLLLFSLIAALRKAWLAVLVSLVSMVFMIASRGSILGWYWFGWIPLIAICLLSPRHKNATYLHPILEGCLLIMLVTCNLVGQYSSILERINSKRQHAESITNLSRVQREVISFLELHSVDQILDYSEVSYRGGLRLPSKEGTEIIQTSPPRIYRLSKEARSTADPAQAQSALDRSKLGILSNAFTGILNLPSEQSPGKRSLIILSRRLANHQPFSEIRTFLGIEKDQSTASSGASLDTLYRDEFHEILLYTQAEHEH